MSEGAGATDQTIEINDLPPGETLTPEEKELLAGAGRMRLTFDALETRQMMDAGIGGALMAPIPEISHFANNANGGMPAPDATPATAVEAPAANQSSDQQDIRQKLGQIREVAAVLKAMDVPDLAPAQWLAAQSRKNQLLTETDKTELTLKHSEIDKLRSQPEKATILADEEAELAIMQDKTAKMTELQGEIEQAQWGHPGADQRVADLMLGISHDELKLKNQQVAALQDRIKNSPPHKQPALAKLLEGEQYEVGQLKQINALNQEIADQVRSGGDAATLAALRRRVVHHELLMKEQNERQLEARLTPDSGAQKGDGAAIAGGPLANPGTGFSSSYQQPTAGPLRG